jgi:hypothetical protein
MKFLVIFLLSMVQLMAVVEMEPNNNKNQAQKLKNNQTCQASVPKGKYDTDWYKFKAKGHAFHLDFQTEEGIRDYTITVLNQQNKEIIHYRVKKGETLLSKNIGVKSGYVYIKITVSYTTNIPEEKYTLTVSGLDENEIKNFYEIQPNGTLQDAQKIKNNISYIGYIPRGMYDIDWYKFKVNGHAFHLEFETDEGLRDYTLEIKNKKQEKVISFRLKKGETKLSKIIGVEAGYVYLKVSTNYITTDPFEEYKLKVSGLNQEEIKSYYEIQPNGSINTAQLIKKDKTYIGYIPRGTYDIDFYKTKIENNSFELEFQTDEGKRDYTIEVINKKQKKIQTYRVKKGENSLKKTIGVEPGYVYIKISASYTSQSPDEEYRVMVK